MIPSNLNSVSFDAFSSIEHWLQTTIPQNVDGSAASCKGEDCLREYIHRGLQILSYSITGFHAKF